jgi:hypothetical protein
MDKKALKILLTTFWSTSGWKKDQSVSPQDFVYAKQAGYMFDPIKISNSQIVGKAIQIRNSTKLNLVTDAFLASLSTRRLELRSAFGSYMVLHDLPMHRCEAKEKQCEICGQYIGDHEEDLNVLNFERFKWGGVRHDQLLYCLFDLEQFLKLDNIKPNKDDFSIFKEVIQSIEKAPSKTTSASLQEYFPISFKSNKSERDNFVQILGLCGILETKDQRGYLDKFVPYVDRVTPDRHFVDMCYPVCWWRKSDGINYGALKRLFENIF